MVDEYIKTSQAEYDAMDEGDKKVMSYWDLQDTKRYRDALDDRLLMVSKCFLGQEYPEWRA